MAKTRKNATTEPAQPPAVETDPDAAHWDDVAEVVVVGFGGAGACAALEAKAEGASVLVLDRFHGGGATAISGGVVYAGGGSHIQQQAGVEDTTEDMVRYLAMEVKDAISPETLRDFCDKSIENLQWLESHGVPFDASLCPYKTSYPTDDYFLYYSGNETLPPFRDAAKPAPRGHRAKGAGLPGANFYEPLRKAAHSAGIDIHYEARVTQLITDADQRVVGVEYVKVKPGFWSWLHRRLHNADLTMVKLNPAIARRFRNGCDRIEARHGTVRRARATRGVVLTAGGFIYNRKMIKELAPDYRPGMPLGTAGDNGSGILLGASVGGATDHMGRVSAWRFINPPEAFAKGIFVNKRGERYVNEFMYGAAVGEAMVDHNEGVATLIIDKPLRTLASQQSRPGRAQWFQWVPAQLNLLTNCKKASNVEELASLIKVPARSLQATLDQYNDAAEGKGPDPFGKTQTQMHPMSEGPYFAIDCSIRSRVFRLPTLTLGGLVVNESTGQVKREDGTAVEGLYAAGRTAVGVCSRQYVSGLSIADCVYSGRRSGRSAARVEVC